MIQIDQLQIRMPGKNEEEGNGLGRQIAENLAEATPEYSGYNYIPEIKVELQRSASDDGTRTADRIAEQIIQQIKLATS